MILAMENPLSHQRRPKLGLMTFQGALPVVALRVVDLVVEALCEEEVGDQVGWVGFDDQKDQEGEEEVVTSRTCLGLYSDLNLFRNLLAPQDTLHPTHSRTLLGPEHFLDILVHTHAKSPLFLFTI